VTTLPALAGALVVSCQAPEGHPLHGPAFMSAMAQAAVEGGAGGIRAEGTADIAAIRARVDVPVLGILKRPRRSWEDVFITATFDDAAAVVRAGASVVAMDGTARPRPHGETLPQIVRRVHDELGVPVMADVDSLPSAEHALRAGCDLIGTTLSGYTSDAPSPDGPDLDLVAAIAALGAAPVVAEGRIWTREDAVAAFDAGASVVVVGTAITNPLLTTRRFVSAVEQRGR